MQYLGGKARCAKWLREILEPHAKNCYTYLEPFLGGAGSFKELYSLCPTSAASDSNRDLILMWKAVADGWEPPEHLSKERYKQLQISEPSPLKTFAGFGCSFGGKWFGGYAENKRGDNYALQSRKSVLAAAHAMEASELQAEDYRYWQPEKEWLVYCDPPYKGTTGFCGDFDHEQFWAACREWSARGAKVFISEYQAPEDFVLVGAKPTTRTLDKQTNSEVVYECLFRWGGLK